MTEALGMDRDGPLSYQPDNPEAAVVVLRGPNGQKGRQLVTEVAFADLIKGRMGFVDIGGNRFVPVSNIVEITEGETIEDDEPYAAIWLDGRPGQRLLVSKLSVDELEERREAAQHAEDRKERAAWRVPVIMQTPVAMAA
ncbi:MAG: hypothetical protein WC807_16555 [Hyphomicrobium sp.]